MLQGFCADHPWTGSQTGAFKQVADVVLPPVAAAVLAGVQGMAWEEQMGGYRTELYDRGAVSSAA